MNIMTGYSEQIAPEAFSINPTDQVKLITKSLNSAAEHFLFQ